MSHQAAPRSCCSGCGCRFQASPLPPGTLLAICEKVSMWTSGGLLPSQCHNRLALAVHLKHSIYGDAQLDWAAGRRGKKAASPAGEVTLPKVPRGHALPS